MARTFSILVPCPHRWHATHHPTPSAQINNVLTEKMHKGVFFPNGMTGKLTGVPGGPDVYVPNVVQVW